MPVSRLGPDILADLNAFIPLTATAWMDGDAIKLNSYGVVILVAPLPGSDFTNAVMHEFGESMPNATYNEPGLPHNMEWYIENAQGKNLVSRHTGRDSHEAVRLYQGAVRYLRGAFPWGGAVIDTAYGLIVGTSGFKEDEDILVSRTVRNRIVMLLDREGDANLEAARDRGDKEGEDGADRFVYGHLALPEDDPKPAPGPGAGAGVIGFGPPPPGYGPGGAKG